MDLHIKKVWLPGAASCLVFFGFYWVLIWLPFDKNILELLTIPYPGLPSLAPSPHIGPPNQRFSP